MQPQSSMHVHVALMALQPLTELNRTSAFSSNGCIAARVASRMRPHLVAPALVKNGDQDAAVRGVAADAVALEYLKAHLVVHDANLGLCPACTSGTTPVILGQGGCPVKATSTTCMIVTAPGPSFAFRAAGSTWQALDELVRSLVRDEHVLHDQPRNARGKEFARWKRAEEVAAEGVHARLIECAPVPDAGPKRPANAKTTPSHRHRANPTATYDGNICWRPADRRDWARTRPDPTTSH